MEYALSVNNLTKIYKNGRGIENVSFNVSEGEIFGFLGPNGAGKTTALKIITGLIKPKCGEAYIFGKNALTDYENAIKNVGSIIENASPVPYLTAYENMKLIANFNSEITDEDIEEALVKTGIINFKNEKTKGFSLGMKQRLGISMAILNKPRLLILDEPLNGLDVEGMVDMRNLFLEMAKTNKTSIVISSHLIHDVELTCSKIGILFNGKMLGCENIDEILKNYSSLENYYLNEVETNGQL